MLGVGGGLGRGRGRGRGKLLENGPPAPLRRPRERSNVAAGEPAPSAAAAVPVALQRQLSGPRTGGVEPQRRVGDGDRSAWANMSVPGSSAPRLAALDPLSPPFVPRPAPARPVSAALQQPPPEPELSLEPEPEPEPELELGDNEWAELDGELTPVNQALIKDIPPPFDAYQSMIYNNIAETLWTMTCQPASFDRLGAVFVDNVNGWLPSSGIRLSVVLDWMLNQVACEPSFRYVCARLCNAMCSRCRVNEGTRTFRDLLLSRCQSLYGQAGELLAENERSFAELTVLFCELYLHVRLAGGEEPIAVLGSAVVGLCGRLLDTITPERVTAVCQALKLTGAVLERQVSPALDALMERVRAGATDPTLALDQRRALLELANLRAAHWGGQAGGRSPPPAPVTHGDGAQERPCSGGLSAEERWFMEHQVHPAEEDEEDELDEAYEAFLDELEQHN